MADAVNKVDSEDLAELASKRGRETGEFAIADREDTVDEGVEPDFSADDGATTIEEWNEGRKRALRGAPSPRIGTADRMLIALDALEAVAHDATNGLGEAAPDFETSVTNIYEQILALDPSEDSPLHWMITTAPSHIIINVDASLVSGICVRSLSDGELTHEIRISPRHVRLDELQAMIDFVAGQVAR